MQSKIMFGEIEVVAVPHGKDHDLSAPCRGCVASTTFDLCRTLPLCHGITFQPKVPNE